MIKEEFNLSDHMIYPNIFMKHYIGEFIARRQAIKDEFVAKVVGLVWGLAHNTKFNVKEFNIEFDKIRREQREKSDELAGEKLAALHDKEKER